MLFLLYKYSHWKHKTKLLMKMQWYCYSSSKLWNFEKIKRCKRSNTLWSKAFKAFLAKWSRLFKRWTRKRRMGNTVEQNSPKQNISRFPLMETVKMRWLLTHELLWKSTVKANRRGSKHQLKHTKPGLSNNPLWNQYHPRTEITIIDNCQQYTEFFNLHSHNCIVTVMAQVGLIGNS